MDLGFEELPLQGSPSSSQMEDTFLSATRTGGDSCESLQARERVKHVRWEDAAQDFGDGDQDSKETSDENITFYRHKRKGVVGLQGVGEVKDPAKVTKRKEFWLEPKLPDVFVHRRGKITPAIVKQEKKFVDAWGISKYRDYIENYPDGCLKGVEFHGEPVWKCTQTQGRYYAISLYTTTEYENLAFEVHVHCRRKELCGFPDRFPFFCKYCDKNFKDKNGLNFHRIKDDCLAWDGPEPLKMYPVWDASQVDELRRICRGRNVTLPPAQNPKGTKRPRNIMEDVVVKARRRKVHESVIQPSKEIQTLASQLSKRDSEDKCILDKYFRDIEGDSGVKGTDCNVIVRRQSQRILQRPHARASTDVIFINNSPSKALSSNEVKSPVKESKAEAAITLQKDQISLTKSTVASLPHEEVLMSSTVLTPPVITKPSAREIVEAEARAHVATFTMKDSLEKGCPLKHVEPTGLYYLIAEEKHMHLIDRQYLDDPDACYNEMLRLFKEGALASRISLAFSSWWINEKVEENKTREVRDQAKAAYLLWDRTNYEMKEEERLDELKNLILYLKYLQKKKAYEADVQAKEVELLWRQEEYVALQLSEFDRNEALRDEDLKWSWSPLFLILRSYSSTSIPKPPWNHTKEELEEIIRVLYEDDNLLPQSLEEECPLIVQAFKLFFMSLYGRVVSLCHPSIGLNRKIVIAIAKDDNLSRQFTRCVNDLLRCGWLWFPKSQKTAHDFQEFQKDVLGLLGFEGYPWKAVFEKIEVFLNRVARRAILDVDRLQQRQVLRFLWCRVGNNIDATKADQILSSIMLQREDIDFGWIFGIWDSTERLSKQSKDCLAEALASLRRLRDSQLEFTFQQLGLSKHLHSSDGDVNVQENIESLDGRRQLDEPEGSDHNICDYSRHIPLQRTSVVSMSLPTCPFKTPPQRLLFAGVPRGFTRTTEFQGLQFLPISSQSTSTEDLNLMQDFSLSDMSREKILLLLHEHQPTPALVRSGDLGFFRTPRDFSHTLQFLSGEIIAHTSPIKVLNLNEVVKKMDKKALKELEISDPFSEEASQPEIILEDAKEKQENLVCQELEERLWLRSTNNKEVSVRDVMEEVLRLQGGYKARGMDFSVDNHNCRLLINEDIDPLEAMEGELSNQLMHWFIVWNTRRKAVKGIITWPYISQNLLDWVEENGEIWESIYWFIKKKMEPDEQQDFFIVPVHLAGHWSLVVMSELHFLHFDSMRNNTAHRDPRFFRLLAKVWAVKSGHKDDSDAWARACSCRDWITVKCPQQKSDWECGWFTLKYMIDFQKNQHSSTQWSKEMCNWFTYSEAVAMKAVVKNAIMEVLWELKNNESTWTGKPCGDYVTDAWQMTQDATTKRCTTCLHGLIKERGGCSTDSIIFLHGLKSCQLKATDLETLEAKKGMLSLDLLEWYLMWLRIDVGNHNVAICGGHFVERLLEHTSRYGESESSIREFWSSEDILTEAPGTDIIVPLLDQGHWSVMILSAEVLIQLDSMNGEIHGSMSLHRILAKIWAVHAGYGLGTTYWKRARDISNWWEPECPQQLWDWECGWYAIKNIMEYCQKTCDPVAWALQMAKKYSVMEALNTRQTIVEAFMSFVEEDLTTDLEWSIILGRSL